MLGALTASTKPIDSIEVHDPALLAAARDLLDHCRSPKEMADSVVAAVKRNELWRSKRCINLLAPEAPSSPTVRALLSAEVGTRAAEGHIGAVNRWFTGTRHIDEIEALCIEPHEAGAKTEEESKFEKIGRFRAKSAGPRV